APAARPPGPAGRRATPRPAGPSSSARPGSVRVLRVQRGGEVALPEGGHHHHDRRAGELLAGADAGGRLDGRAGGDAHQQALGAGHGAGPVHRGLRVDVDDLVVDLAVQDAWHEVRPEALDLVRAGLAAVEDRGLLGLDGDDLHPGLALLEHLAHAADGPAGADPGDHGVDRAVGVRPDLLGGGAAVDLDVGGVVEL